MKRARDFVLTVSTLILLSGCYSARPLNLDSEVSGQRVVIELTAEGRSGMASLIGADALSIEGFLVESDNEQWVLSVRSVHHPAAGVRWNGERVNIPGSYVDSIVEKRLSRTRTALLVGTIASAAVGAAHEFIDILPSDGSDGGGGAVPGL